MAKAGGDNTVKLWEVGTGHLLNTFPTPDAGPNRSYLAFSQDGRLLAWSSPWGSKIRIWEVHTLREIHELIHYGGGVNALAFSPDDGLLASGSGYKKRSTIVLWNVSTGRERRTLTIEGLKLASLAFNPNSYLVISALNERGDVVIKQWDLSTGNEANTLLFKSPSQVSTVSLNHDGDLLGAAGKNGTVWVGHALTGSVLCTFNGHKSSIKSLAFSRDGRWLASVSNDFHDHVIIIWDLRTQRESQSLPGRVGSAHVPITFSPDGSLLASDDQIWKIATASKVLTLERSNVLGIKNAVVSPDGRRLALVRGFAAGSRVVVWDVPTATHYNSQTLLKSYASSKDRKFLLLVDKNSSQFSAISDC